MFSAALFAAAAFLVFLGYRDYKSRERFAQKGVRVTGRVVDTYLRETPTTDFKGRSKTDRNMIETIEFHTVGGTPILGRPSDGVGERNRMGMTVRVIYDPDSPNNFLAPASEDAEISVIEPFVTMAAGGFFALVALIFLFT